jgi:hypothetical protein
MEKLNRKILKERLLLSFIGISMVLILLIWGSNLVQREQTQPDYYRETYQYDIDSIWFTETAIAEQYYKEYGVTPTPPPTREHRGGGSGDGEGSGIGGDHGGKLITPTP